MHHITGYHKCGLCGIFGHGQFECSQNNDGNYDLINQLYVDNKHHQICLPISSQCSIQSCKSKHTHSTMSHHDFFSRDEYGSLLGPDQYRIKARKVEIKQKCHELLKNNLNSFIQMYWSMGTSLVFRNLNGKIEMLSYENNPNNQYNEFIYGLTKITNKI
jgi:hypothetical protein